MRNISRHANGVYTGSVHIFQNSKHFDCMCWISRFTATRGMHYRGPFANYLCNCWHQYITYWFKFLHSFIHSHLVHHTIYICIPEWQENAIVFEELVVVINSKHYRLCLCMSSSNWRLWNSNDWSKTGFSVLYTIFDWISPCLDEGRVACIYISGIS